MGADDLRLRDQPRAALLLLNIPGYGGREALLLFYLVAVVQLSDVLQYVFG